MLLIVACHCGHDRVLPCFQVEDCIMLQRNPRGLHIHINQAGDWNLMVASQRHHHSTQLSLTQSHSMLHGKGEEASQII